MFTGNADGISSFMLWIRGEQRENFLDCHFHSRLGWFSAIPYLSGGRCQAICSSFEKETTPGFKMKVSPDRLNLVIGRNIRVNGPPTFVLTNKEEVGSAIAAHIEFTARLYCSLQLEN